MSLQVSTSGLARAGRCLVALGALLAISTGRPAAIVAQTPQLPASANATFAPPEFAPLQALYEKVMAPGWKPEVSFVATDGNFAADFWAWEDKPVLPKGCKGAGRSVAITIKMKNPGDAKTVSSYRGEAKECRPNGQGVVTYSDGSVWIGGVVSAQGDGGFSVVPVASGVGINRVNSANIYPLQIDRNSFYQVTESNGFSYRRERRDGIVAVQNAPGEFYRSGGDANGNGPITIHYPDGSTLKLTLLEGGRIDTSAEALYDSGDGLIAGGLLSDLTADGPVFALTSAIELVLRTARGHLPAGAYAYLPATAERSATITPAGLMDLANRMHLSPAVGTTPDMLKAALENVFGCRAPDTLPSGWIVWWPNCEPPAGDSGGVTRMFSADGKEIVIWDWNAGRAHTWSNFVDQVMVRSFTLSPNLGTSEPVNAWIQTEFGLTLYKGPLHGMKPHGPGTCTPPSRPAEACLFDLGNRIDPIHLARLEAKRAEEAAARSRDAAARAAMDAESRRIAEQRAREEEEERLRLAERRRRQDYEDALAQPVGNPFLDVFTDLGRKYSESAADLANSAARNQAILDDYNASVERERAAQQARVAADAAARDARQREAANAAAAAQAAADARAREAQARLAAAERAARDAAARQSALSSPAANGAPPAGVQSDRAVPKPPTQFGLATCSRGTPEGDEFGDLYDRAVDAHLRVEKCETAAFQAGKRPGEILNLCVAERAAASQASQASRAHSCSGGYGGQATQQ